MWTRFTCLAGCVSLSKVRINRKLFFADAIVEYEMILERALDIDRKKDMKLAGLMLSDG